MIIVHVPTHNSHNFFSILVHIDQEMSSEDTVQEKLRAAQKIFTELKDACMNPTSVYFSVSSNTRIENTCSKVNKFCGILRNIKLESGKKWPQLCEKFKMKAKFCPDSKCETILDNDGKPRYIVPLLYTYLEKVGIMQYHLNNNEYISSLGLGLTNGSNYNVPLTAQEKTNASVLITQEILLSKPRHLTSQEKLDIYLDIQQKAENARFLRKMNEFCCIEEKKRTSTESGVGHEKWRFIIKKFISVMEILTQKTRQDSSSEGTNSSINDISRSQSSVDYERSRSNERKRRQPAHERRKKRKK